MTDCSFPGLLVSSGEATLDDPSLCYQDPGRLTGKLENIHCPRGPVGGSFTWPCSRQTVEVNLKVRQDASNPFSRSLIILSLGLLADDASQACTLAMLTVWVTPGLLASTSNSLAAPGAQSCSRNART